MKNPKQMLLAGLPELPNDMEDDWYFGRPFSEPPPEPVVVFAQEGFEGYEVLPLFDDPFLVTNEVAKIIEDAGVDRGFHRHR